MGQMVLIFNEDGTVYKETRGFKGKACTKKTQFIEEALGIAGNKTFKTEYHEPEDQKETLRQ